MIGLYRCRFAYLQEMAEGVSVPRCRIAGEARKRGERLIPSPICADLCRYYSPGKALPSPVEATVTPPPTHDTPPT